MDGHKTGREQHGSQKRTKEIKIDYLVKYQSQEYQKALTFVQILWNTVYGQCLESFQLALEKKSFDLGTWDNCRDKKDLLTLLDLIDMVCNNGSTGTNKDETYVCISQFWKFHNFTH